MYYSSRPYPTRKQNQYQYPNLNPNPYWINEQIYNMSQFPFWFNPQMYNMNPYAFWGNTQVYNNRPYIQLKDYGPMPFVVDIEDATTQNNTFRTVLWTGENLQVTVMSIDVGSDIGLEVHQTGDQFIRIEEGEALVQMGDSKDNLDFQRRISDDFAIMIPAGKWHNIINTGNKPLKLYAIYAPPEHPSNTVHKTKADAQED